MASDKKKVLLKHIILFSEIVFIVAGCILLGIGLYLRDLRRETVIIKQLLTRTSKLKKKYPFRYEKLSGRDIFM